MLYTYFAARSARPIAAFLIMGSLTGFVVGQRLGHPAPVAHHPVATHTVAAQHASGGLGTPVVNPLSQPLPAAAPTSDHNGDHQHGQGGKHDKHGGSDGGGGGGGGDHVGGGGG